MTSGNSKHAPGASRNLFSGGGGTWSEKPDQLLPGEASKFENCVKGMKHAKFT